MRKRAAVLKMIKTKIKFLKIHPAWSKGLTKYTHKSLMRTSIKFKINNPETAAFLEESANNAGAVLNIAALIPAVK